MHPVTPNLQINSRLLARLISNAGFQKMISPSGVKTYSRQLRKVIESGGISLPVDFTLSQLINLSYDHLQEGYRHEYIYKTKLLSDFILKKYSLDDTIILNEFRIGKSVADMVLVNGTNKVFEIKTELDSPERLKTQLNDYYKAFSEVYIVTHHTLAAKYKSIVDERVGLIEFNGDYSLYTSRDAIIDQTRLDNLVMMKSLRKGEFLDIVKKINGQLPVTTQVKLYKECLNIVNDIDASVLQKYFLTSVKGRIRSEHKLVLNNDVPDYLKFFCYLVNFTEKQYLALPARLSCLV
ncbi:sce7726 family protein [Mucilaginibacter sp. Mucisp84]|uniref:sce7726 family protein n=1 Tax=Mucilaginibacter sp. Mucisp84 TaxID=3243058 RepID=UPI0039A67482